MPPLSLGRGPSLGWVPAPAPGLSINNDCFKEQLRQGAHPALNVLKTKGDTAMDRGLEINFPFAALIWVRWARRLGLPVPGSPFLMTFT